MQTAEQAHPRFETEQMLSFRQLNLNFENSHERCLTFLPASCQAVRTGRTSLVQTKSYQRVLDGQRRDSCQSFRSRASRASACGLVAWSFTDQSRYELSGQVSALHSSPTCAQVALENLTAPCTGRRIRQDLGWECHTLSYPSSSQKLQQLAEGVAEQVQGIAGPDRPVWAVTHSMGGIVLRHIMQMEDKGALPGVFCFLSMYIKGKGCYVHPAGSINWAGAVLIGPPNHGSQSARIFSRLPGIGLFFK